MKKVKNRALSAMLIVAAVVSGLCVYMTKLAGDGGRWAAFASNLSPVRAVGVLTDRNGVVLAGKEEGARVFAGDESTRRAVLHAVGDAEGKIGTGALRIFAEKLTGYDIFNGTYSRTGEGETVALSIDSKLCRTAQEALGGRKGTAIVINYETGEVVCVTSSPTFDPVSPPEAAEDNPELEGVYLNRAISSAYTPGSIFKLVTTAAALENIDDIKERVFECTGSRIVGESTVTCPSAHGTLKLEDALAESCNTVYADLALELGSDVLERYTCDYGLVDRLTINTVKTAGGRFDKGEAGSAALAWSGVGQYNNELNPAAIARFAGAVATGGSAVELTFLRKSGAGTQTGIIRKETADRLGDMMRYCVANKYGSDSFPGLEMYAKSGTAEVGENREPHAWFTGFIRNEGYPLAFAVIVENGGSGSGVAGKVANKVLQAAVFGEGY